MSNLKTIYCIHLDTYVNMLEDCTTDCKECWAYKQDKELKRLAEKLERSCNENNK
jgi:hypothetical protein